MSDWPGLEALFGALNSAATSGAQQQQANADYWRKQQEGMLNAWQPQIAGVPCLSAESAKMDAEGLFPRDWLYWNMLIGMALTAITFWACTH